MRIRGVSDFDYLLLLTMLALTSIGILFIYSSVVNSEGHVISREYLKQIVWAVMGVVLMLSVSMYDYHRFKDRTTLIFAGFILLLIYTRLFGRYVNGAKSWIGVGEFGIQISEFAKIAYILYLAHYLVYSQSEPMLKRFAKAGVITLLPMALILSQPDLGTASVYLPIFLVMCFIAGFPLRLIFAVVCVVLLTLLFTLLPLWEQTFLQYQGVAMRIADSRMLSLFVFFSLSATSAVAVVGYLLSGRKYYYWITYALGMVSISYGASLLGVRVLKPYQMMRLIIFLNPEVDPLKAGWHIIQSMIAIGSGGAFGMGYLRGPQSHYRFLPQQSTDFIFSILSEEWGFVGGVIVFGLYLLFFLHTLSIMSHVDDLYGKLIASGVLGMFLFHFVVNVGMTMGIMPITGIPLLLLSYGGSSLWTAMIATGLLMSINARQL